MAITVILSLFAVFFTLILWATHNSGHNHNSDGGDF